LKLGASTTISLYVMPKILSSYHRKYPNVKLLLINRNSENVLKALIDKEIDIAIIEAHYKINSVDFKPFMHDEIIAICAWNSPFGKEEIPIEELKKIPISLRERGSGTHAVLQKYLDANKIRLSELNVIARLGGTEALKNFLIEDNSIGFLSRMAVKDELQSRVLREVNITGMVIKRQFEFVVRKGEDTAGIVNSFIKEAKNHYNK